MIARLGKIGLYGACLSLFCLTLAAQAWAWMEHATYRLNTTPSMPIGFWAVSRTHPQHIRRGEVVSVCLPLAVGLLARSRGYVSGGECRGGTTPMLKSIAALPGDMVIVSERGIAVNGNPLPHSIARRVDDKNRPLNALPYGAYHVSQKQVWLYGGHDPRSFDSRYYGVIPQINIIGAAWPLLIFR